MTLTAFVEDIITRAGELAMEHFLNVDPTWKENRTYVTEADLAVQAYLQASLEARFPEDGLIGEEAGLRKAPRAGGRTWIVDPIDGTSAFSGGLPVWGISIGVLEEGRPTAGFFYMPVTGDLFAVTAEGGVLRNGAPTQLKPPGPFHRETVFLVDSRFHHGYAMPPDFPGKLRSLGSAAAHLCYAATGCVEGAITREAHVWDIAAGVAMVLRSGGACRYLDGAPLDMDALLMGDQLHLPLVVGHPETVAAILRTFRYRALD
jgi:myo-inositol-1(or 4)-monophosphatase